MEASDLIALFALVISFGSFYIGKRSLDFAIEMQKASEQKLIENEKTELLKQISNSKSVLKNAYIEIGALKADFDIEPQLVIELMRNYTDLFSEYLPSIESAISMLENDYANLANWPSEISYSDLMRAKAKCHDDLKGFEITHEQAIQCVSIFKEKLREARAMSVTYRRH